MKEAVCLLLQIGDGFLSVSRRGNSNLWGLPGGKVDEGETNAEAMVRELFEETGVVSSIDSFKPIFCGVAEGEVNYLVTTYLWTDGEIKSEIKPEDGLLSGLKTEDELCDDTMSPFALYNKRVFKAKRDYTELLQMIISNNKD